MHMHKGFFYPDSDTKLKKVHDWVEDIDTILKHVDRFEVCVQAGGAVGVWPAVLAEHFDTVYTFEPVAENYDCLIQNVPDNVVHYDAALGREISESSVSRDRFEDGNAGAWYVTGEAGRVPVITIDSLHPESCDLIQLDVEGSEYDVLQGAVRTLITFRPVVVIEEKQLPHMKEPCTRAREWLETLGYRVVDKMHRDIVLKI